MYSHNMVGSNDIDKSKKFYDATFKAMGADEAIKDDKGRLIYMHNNSMFLVTPPINCGGRPCGADFLPKSPSRACRCNDTRACRRRRCRSRV